MKQVFLQSQQFSNPPTPPPGPTGFKSVPNSPLPAALGPPSARAAATASDHLAAADVGNLIGNIAELDSLLGVRANPLARERRDSGMDSPTLLRYSPQACGIEAAPQDCTGECQLGENNGSCGGIRRGTKFRWSSFARSHRPSIQVREMQIAAMSIAQMQVLKNAAFLELNKVMQEFCPPNKSLLSWFLPKFLRRAKPPIPPSKTAVFGVPLTTVQMRCGQPLPPCIVHMMRQLRQSGVSAHGIFRRTGGKARVSSLKAEIDAQPDMRDFSQCQPYDLADLVKMYLRELPECLVTTKLSPTLMDLFTFVPSDQLRLLALQCAMLLLPDENREVLQSLLYFLKDFAENADTTQMNASNLAVCLAPSLFYFPHETPTGSGLSPRRFRRATGVPDPRDLQDHKAATACVTFMITHCHQLFTVSEELYRQAAFSAVELAEPPALDSLAPVDASQRRHCFAFVDNHAQMVGRECSEGAAKWTPFSSRCGVETFCKKLDDKCPLRLWKAVMNVEADPTRILNRIVQDKASWDPDVLNSELVEMIDDNSDVTRFTLTSPPAQPAREQCVLRAWRSAGSHSHCLYTASVRLPPTPLTLPTLILNEDWLIEACGPGNSRVTLLSRVDLRGHSLEWYNRTWGHSIARQLVHLKKSFAD
uniref:Rho-GAP domain-containing protein n=1 Tax=Macrostomum lignano TaxID=282301 RepID=A0A1I8G2C9_9PLAT